MKKEVLLIALLLLPMAFADIPLSLKLQESRKFVTLGGESVITFSDYDPVSGRYFFYVNTQKIPFFISQEKSVGGMSIRLTGISGSTIDSIQASLAITQYEPFECRKECEDNIFMDFMQVFDNDFNLCKKNCTAGCSLFHEIRCVDNTTWEFDNCGNKLKMIKSCPQGCNNGYCTNCSNGLCEPGETFLDCNDCNVPNFCISDDDCEGKCINGFCTHNNFVIGDGICSPAENCSSVDCSCLIPVPKKTNYPLVLFHGFTSTPEKMKKLARDISFYLDYDYGDELTDNCEGFDSDTVFVSTFYDTDNALSIIEPKTDLLEKPKPPFIDKFSKVIQKVRLCTDSDKVDVIAHSFGGQIALRYLLSNSNMNSINKLILLGTPLRGGIYGEQNYELFKGLEASLGDRSKLVKDCSQIGVPSVVMSFIDGRDVTMECQQLSDATVMDVLATDETLGPVEYYTISGKIDSIGDGVVSLQSTMLDGAVFNDVVDCNHFDLKDPYKCKNSLVLITRALGHDEGLLEKKSLAHRSEEFIYGFFDFFAGLI